MDHEVARSFVGANHRAVLSTRRKDGSPQLSPVAVALDPRGRVVVSTREAAAKVLNVRRDPSVAVCVFTDAFFGQWVQVDGTAEVISLPEAMEGLVSYYRSASGEHPDWDDYRSAMVRDRRCLIAITITRAGPDYSG